MINGSDVKFLSVKRVKELLAELPDDALLAPNMVRNKMISGTSIF